jgi:hypothetical protein
MSVLTTDLHKAVKARMAFERLDLQVVAAWSNVHPEFYVVTGFGFPTFLYVLPHDRWFSAYNEMMRGPLWRQLEPRVEHTLIKPQEMADIYRRGIPGLVKWRILK